MAGTATTTDTGNPLYIVVLKCGPTFGSSHHINHAVQKILLAPTLSTHRECAIWIDAVTLPTSCSFVFSTPRPTSICRVHLDSIVLGRTETSAAHTTSLSLWRPTAYRSELGHVQHHRQHRREHVPAFVFFFTTFTQAISFARSIRFEPSVRVCD